MRMIYVADPMCSWCYGFGAPLQALLDDPQAGIELTLVMGGLRPYTTEALSPGRADEIFGHWHHVHEASGLPFAQAPHTALHEPGFVYDTEPASRATIVVRQLWPAQAWAYFKAVQKSFYAEARNVTRSDVLADLAEAQDLPRAEFISAFESAAMQQATRDDFEQSQAWGIRGFPALIAEHAGQLHLVANGFMPVDELRVQLTRLLARLNSPDTAKDAT